MFISAHSVIYFFPLKNTLLYAFPGFEAVIILIFSKNKKNFNNNSFKFLLGTGGIKGIPKRYKQEVLNNLNRFTKRNFIGCAGIEAYELVTNKLNFVIHGRVTPWDHAPIDLIIKESGGIVNMLRDNQSFDIVSNGPLLTASNKNLWHKIRNLTRSNLYRIN